MKSNLNKIDHPIDTIVQGDCRTELYRLPEQCADVIFADPPYNLQLSNPLRRPDNSLVDAVNDSWDSFSSLQEYDAFTTEWLTACRHALKDTGTIWVIGSYHCIFRIGAIMQDLGFWILNDIVWIKTNPTPNMNGTRFCNAHDTLIWAKKSQNQKGYTFNYRTMKAGNEDVQMRSDWYIPLCTGSERLLSGGTKSHSTQKPLALLNRVITASTRPGDVVLDPFFGSGTTGVAAKLLNRRYIGIERESAYVNLATQRLDAVAANSTYNDDEVPDLDAPVARVPFCTLIELGLLMPGDILTSTDHTAEAIVQQDGTIVCGKARGSIHSVGAAVAGKPTCNGWQNWLYRDRETGAYRSVDDLRNLVRQQSVRVIDVTQEL